MKTFDIISHLNLTSTEYFSGENSYLRLYENRNFSDYENIVSLLKSNGAEILLENRIDENSFCFLSFNGENVSCGYFPSENAIRIVSETGYNFPDFSFDGKIKKEYTSELWQFEVDHKLIDCGMCYIMRCYDGSFILIDSAHTYSINDCDRIHDFLRERTPKGEKIRIAGWLFTHGHDDHIAQFMNYLKFCMNDTVIDGLYYNLVDVDHRDSHNWGPANRGYVTSFHKLIKEHPEIPVYRLHTGMKFYIKNYLINVLCSHEDIFPESNLDYNDSSVVTKFETDGTSILFPGDAAIESSKILERRYPHFLESDIIQCSHHGHIGTSSEFYRMVKAKLALVPNTQIKYDEEFVKVEATRVMAELAEKLYISSNGTVEVPLPYNPETIKVYPDETFESFEGVYNLWSYEYTPEFKEKLYNDYLSRGGKPLDEYKNGF